MQKWKVAGVIIILNSLLACCASSAPLVRDAVMTQRIEQPLNTATTDDYLLDLARAGKLNIVVDSTGFSSTLPVQPYPSTSGAKAGLEGSYRDKWGPIILNLLGDVTVQQHLSLLRADERTLLLWTRPNPRSLLERQLAVAESADADRFAVATPEIMAATGQELNWRNISESEIRSVLLAYLKSQYGWTPTVANRNAGINLQFKLDELPPAVRALTLWDLRQHFVLPGQLFLLRETLRDSDSTRIALMRANGDLTLRILSPWQEKDGTATTRSGYLFSVATDAVRQDSINQGALTPTTVKPAVFWAFDAAPEPTNPAGKDDIFACYGGLLAQSVTQLEAAPELQRPITIEVKRLPLREVLGQLQGQSGIKFTLDASAPTSALLTAHVDQMPLARFLALLTRVYGVEWTPAGTGYVMQGNKRGNLHLTLLRMGDPDRYESFSELFNRPAREQERVTFVRSLLGQAGLEALQKPDGMALAALPPASRSQLVHIVETLLAESLDVDLYYTNRMFAEQLANQGLILRFANAKGRRYGTPFHGFAGNQTSDTLQFSVESKDGTIAVPVFDNFGFEVAQPGEQDAAPPRPRSRRR